jgi:hypothetical protein
MADEVKGDTKPPQVTHKDDLKFAAMTKEAVAAAMKTDMAKVRFLTTTKNGLSDENCCSYSPWSFFVLTAITCHLRLIYICALRCVSVCGNRRVCCMNVVGVCAHHFSVLRWCLCVTGLDERGSGQAFGTEWSQ